MCFSARARVCVCVCVCVCVVPKQRFRRQHQTIHSQKRKENFNSSWSPSASYMKKLNSWCQVRILKITGGPRVVQSTKGPATVNLNKKGFELLRFKLDSEVSGIVPPTETLMPAFESRWIILTHDAHTQIVPNAHVLCNIFNHELCYAHW